MRTMKISEIVSLITVVIVARLVYMIGKEFYESELNLANFMLVQVSKLTVNGLFPKNETKSLVEGRAQYFNSVSGDMKSWTGQLSLVQIDRADGPPIPLRVYHPANHTKGNLLPVVMWIHGGGFVVGSALADDYKCKLLSSLSNALIINVDYRLAPEHMYPAGLNDVHHTLEWIHQHIHNYDGDASQIIIAGESAGGSLAAAVTSLNNNTIKLSGLLLIYPPISYDVFKPSYLNFKVARFLYYTQMLWFWNLYVGEERMSTACKQYYTVCPSNTPSSILKNYPKTAVILAQHDILVDEGRDFHELLLQHGVDSSLLILPDVVHGFFGLEETSASAKLTRKFIKEQMQVMLTSSA